MKKVLSALVFALSLTLILLSFAVPVNHFALPTMQDGSRVVADGVPLPPPIPPKGGTLVADGVPLPPPIPPKGGLFSANQWVSLQA